MKIPNFKAKDLVALTTIFMIFLLVIVKANHSFDAILALILGYYFGHRASGVDRGE